MEQIPNGLGLCPQPLFISSWWSHGFHHHCIMVPREDAQEILSYKQLLFSLCQTLWGFEADLWAPGLPSTPAFSQPGPKPWRRQQMATAAAHTCEALALARPMSALSTH